MPSQPSASVLPSFLTIRVIRPALVWAKLNGAVLEDHDHVEDARSRDTLLQDYKKKHPKTFDFNLSLGVPMNL
jgi:hypothetical protein